MTDEGHAKRPDPSPMVAEQGPKRGWLKNGNPPGDLRKAKRCGAKTRKGTPCTGPAMPNGRCRMHGGPSTGPRTPEGLQRSRKAGWKHGRRSAEAIAERRRAREAARETRALIRALRDVIGPP